VALTALLLGVGVGWTVHQPADTDGTPFQGEVLNVDSNQRAIGVRTDEQGDIGGLLANDGAPVRVGERISGMLYGRYHEIIRVTSTGR
jgi:hypothetical protein